jgi:putative transposase
MRSLRETQLPRRQIVPGLREQIEADPERRYQLVSQVARSLGVSRSTVRRWLAKDPGSPGRPRSSRVVLDDALKGLFYACGCNVAQFRERAIKEGRFGDEPPSVWTLRRAVRTQIPRAERVLAERGPRGLRDEAMVFLPTSFPYRGHTYLLDHCELPLYVMPPAPQKRLVKPWFTGVMDGMSRAIVGFAISLAPNSTTIAAAMASAIALDPDGRNPFEGIPENVLIDNGRDFLSKHFEAAMLTIGTAVTPHVAYRPNVKGKLERFHSTLRMRLAETPGFAGGPKLLDGTLAHERGERWLHFAEVYGLVQGIVEEYHGSVHSAMGCTPRQAWEMDPTPLRTVKNRAEVATLLMKVAERRVTKNGVAMFGKHFMCPEIAVRKGEVLQVRYWPHDQREIYLFQDGVPIGVATDPLVAMDQDAKRRFWTERDRQVKEATRAVRRQKVAHRMSYGPVVSAEAEPELVSVGKARRRSDGETARKPVSEAAVALAFGEIDYSFPVDEYP